MIKTEKLCKAFGKLQAVQEVTFPLRTILFSALRVPMAQGKVPCCVCFLAC